MVVRCKKFKTYTVLDFRASRYWKFFLCNKLQYIDRKGYLIRFMQGGIFFVKKIPFGVKALISCMCLTALWRGTERTGEEVGKTTKNLQMDLCCTTVLFTSYWLFLTRICLIYVMKEQEKRPITFSCSCSVNNICSMTRLICLTACLTCLTLDCLQCC